jgi:hypothetical protein
MICQPCRIAGDANQNKDEDAARKYHDKCRANDCMCQHRVGVYVETKNN